MPLMSWTATWRPGSDPRKRRVAEGEHPAVLANEEISLVVRRRNHANDVADMDAESRERPEEPTTI